MPSSLESDSDAFGFGSYSTHPDAQLKKARGKPTGRTSMTIGLLFPIGFPPVFAAVFSSTVSCVLIEMPKTSEPVEMFSTNSVVDLHPREDAELHSLDVVHTS